MPLALIHSRTLHGLAAPAVTVEVHLANGLPSFSLVGLADTEVKEARERVRAALLQSELPFPNNQRITVNLAPADLPKDSGRFDLPIALGILAASGVLCPKQLDAHEFAGELSLGGELRPIRGALAMALGTLKAGQGRTLVLPPGSAQEAAQLPGLSVCAATRLSEVAHALMPGGDAPALTPMPPGTHPSKPAPGSDLGLCLSQVHGHALAKRALLIAAAGGHNLLFSGPPGSGKSMLAQRLPGLLPPLTDAEAMESAAILSVSGCFDASTWGQRPFRAPHHTASGAALCGGGRWPQPGEISLAHHGILFLDELPEFQRPALEALREPLETGHITIARAGHSAQFPARFQLVAAMNPCPCGLAGHPKLRCRCTPEAVLRYQGRISAPLLDRLDLHLDVPAQDPATRADGPTSAALAPLCAEARSLQWQRQGCLNAALSPQHLPARHQLTGAAQTRLEHIARQWHWSTRAQVRCWRLARTIADLAQAGPILPEHVSEAAQYRRALSSTPMAQLPA